MPTNVLYLVSICRGKMRRIGSKKDINDIDIKQTSIFRNLLTYQTDHLKSNSTDTLKSNNFTDFSLDCVSKKIKPKITLDGLRVFN